MTEIPLRILMVSTEYPPMQGGVGRYTFNLTEELRRIGLDVRIACNEKGSGQFFGLSPNNPHNSDVLLRIVEEVSPDIVHVQYEPGLYGLVLDPINPRNTNTNIDLFYNKCEVPIVTTFHSAYTFRQWLSLVLPLEGLERMKKTGILLCRAGDYWRRILNYRSFHNLNKEKLRESKGDSLLRLYGKGGWRRPSNLPWSSSPISWFT